MRSVENRLVSLGRAKEHANVCTCVNSSNRTTDRLQIHGKFFRRMIASFIVNANPLCGESSGSRFYIHTSPLYNIELTTSNKQHETCREGNLYAI